MLPACVREDARGIVVHDLEVGHQRRPGIEPLEKVVRKHGVLGYAVFEGRHKSVDVVKAFAGKYPLVKEILV
jgi:hypothetical protein